MISQVDICYKYIKKKTMVFFNVVKIHFFSFLQLPPASFRLSFVNFIFMFPNVSFYNPRFIIPNF